MRSEGRAGSSASILSAVMACILSALVILYPLDERNLSFTNDMAAVVAVATVTLEGDIPLSGPPSSRGGRHLGPFLYWLTAGVSVLANGDLTTTVRLLVILQFLGVLATAALAFRLVEPRDSFWAATGVLVVAAASKYYFVVRDPWQMHIALLISALLFHSYLNVLQRGWGSVLVFGVAVSVALQIHFAFFPVIAALALVSAWFLWRRFPIVSPTRYEMVLQLIPLSLLVLLWVPTLIYEIRYSNGIAALPFFHARVESSAGVPAAFRLLRQFLAAFSATMLVPSKTAEGLTLLCSLLSALLGWILLVINSRGGQQRRFLGGAFLAIVLMGFAVASQHNPLHEYYFYPILPLPGLFVGIFFANAWSFSEEKFRLVGAQRFLSLVTIGTLAGIGVTRHVAQTPKTPITASLANARAVTQAIFEDGARTGVAYSLTPISSAAMMEDTYLFLLGRDFYPLMPDTEKLIELKSFAPHAALRLAAERPVRYLLMCPRPWSFERKRIEDRIAAPWVLQRSFTAGDCASSVRDECCQVDVLGRGEG